MLCRGWNASHPAGCPSASPPCQVPLKPSCSFRGCEPLPASRYPVALLEGRERVLRGAPGRAVCLPGAFLWHPDLLLEDPGVLASQATQTVWAGRDLVSLPSLLLHCEPSTAQWVFLQAELVGRRGALLPGIPCVNTSSCADPATLLPGVQTVHHKDEGTAEFFCNEEGTY